MALVLLFIKKKKRKEKKKMGFALGKTRKCRVYLFILI